MTLPSAVNRANTILYAKRWKASVAFYRDCLGLEVVFRNDWFVEFRLTPTAYLSVADQSRTTMASGNGKGITLSFRIDDLQAAHRAFIKDGLVPTAIRAQVMGADVFYLTDPEGNRIEFWSPG
ncbi:VOC family protein [uncultured Desulfosarcina sp.]|uniref:VOC family protein n=1 Tax=uncultured Desulfosarcina sp. TaxID=218289 RepID=UPI0029C7EA61|nr:VOC family protein [uncultured Desulfosarcina sp.]